MSAPPLVHRVARTVAALALASVPLGVAFARDVEIAVRGPGGTSASPLATLSRLGLALAVVLIAFWGCARLMRRLQRVSEAGGGGLRIVGGLSLGQRERLVVVEAGGEQLLLGVCAGRIERLHVLDSPLGQVPGRSGTAVAPTVAPAVASAAANGFAPGDFRAKLLAAMQRRVPS